jgi:hypothetical protein
MGGATGSPHSSVTTLEQPVAAYTGAAGDRLLAAAAFTLPPLVLLAVALGLAFRGGGVVPGQWQPVALGTAASLLVLAAVGAMPSLSRSALLMLGVWAALLGWTAVSLTWSLSREATFEAITRAALLAGVVATAAIYASRARAALALAAGTALCGALIAALLEAKLLAGNADVFAGSRLAWPMNYANADAALLWLPVPALVAFAGSYPLRPLSRGAFGTFATLALALGLTAESRGASIALAAALAGCVVVARDRARLALTLAGIAAPVAVAAPWIVDDATITSAVARERGVVALAAAVLGGASVGALALLDRRHRFPFDGRQGRVAAVVVAVASVAALALFLAASGRPDTWLADRWHEFTDTASAPATTPNLTTGSSNRYEYWRVAWEATRERPVAGVGAGAFSVPWFRERSLDENVTDAHSWQAGALAELGVVGLVLTAAALLVPLAGVVRARGGDGAWPIAAVALGGSALYFVFHASFDWLLRVPAAAIPGLLALGALAGAGASRRLRLADLRARVLVAGAALAAALVILPAYVATAALERAESDAPTDPDRALDALETATRFNPFAVQPLVQRSSILSFNGDAVGAVQAAEEAVERGPNDWAAWVVLSEAYYAVRDEARGREARRRVRELNPRTQAIPD